MSKKRGKRLKNQRVRESEAVTSYGASVNKRRAQQIKKMIGESRELRNMKGLIRGERSVREKEDKSGE